MWNIKALALTVQMLLAKLKFSKKGSNSKVKVTVSKILVPTERNTHVKYQSYSTHCSKVISKVKVSERRTEWLTGQKQYAPYLRSNKNKNAEDKRILKQTKTFSPSCKAEKSQQGFLTLLVFHNVLKRTTLYKQEVYGPHCSDENTVQINKHI